MIHVANEYVKSPMNYIGGKYKLLPHLTQHFPKNINTMVDLFCGGCDVAANVEAKTIYANDINCYIIGMFKAFQQWPTEQLLGMIDETIARYGLTKENRTGFNWLRTNYNTSEDKNPIDMFVLMCYSFNHQIRFNSKHEYNSSFGQHHCYFSDMTRRNLIMFKDRIQNVQFSCENYKTFDDSILQRGDFMYADPPYLITTAPYNDGNRGFECWTEQDDRRLTDLLDALDSRGVLFALSNVLEHKGKTNSYLSAWADKYNVHPMDYGYEWRNYHGKNTDRKTLEVLVTNY